MIKNIHLFGERKKNVKKWIFMIPLGYFLPFTKKIPETFLLIDILEI